MSNTIPVPDWALWVGAIGMTLKSVFDYMAAKERAKDDEREEDIKRYRGAIAKLEGQLEEAKAKFDTQLDEMRETNHELSKKLARAEERWNAATSTEIPSLPTQRGKLSL